MLENCGPQVSNLIDWYIEVKKAYIDAESLDVNFKNYVQPSHEIRYSFDHFIRAITWDNSDMPNGESSEKAIASSIGHLKRAYCDIVEWSFLSVMQKYDRVLKKYSPEVILKGFPDYYSVIKPRLLVIQDEINVYKNNKSVESDEKLFLDSLMKEIVDYNKKIEAIEPSLIEVKKDLLKNTIVKSILIPLIIAAISAVVSFLLGKYA